MKKILIAISLAAGLVGTALAQPATADVILGFRVSTGGTNLAIDLGQMTGYSAGSTTILGNLLGNTTTSGATSAFGLTAGTNTVDAIYGSTWNTNASLLWAAVGALNDGSTNTDTLFGTAKANSSLLNGSASSVGWTAASDSSQAGGTSKIQVVYNSFGTSTFRTSTETATGAWTKQLKPASGTVGFGWFNPYTSKLENSTNITASYVASDLYLMAPTDTATNAGTTFLGTLAILSNGNVEFIAAVPEPSTYAALLGLGTLAIVAIRRRRQAAVAV